MLKLLPVIHSFLGPNEINIPHSIYQVLFLAETGFASDLFFFFKSQTAKIILVHAPDAYVQMFL